MAERSAEVGNTMITVKSIVRIALVFAMAVATAGPALAEAYVSLLKAKTEVPEEFLLDVGIQVFEPGLPEEDEDSLEKRGVYADVRKSEARYIPFHLKDQLAATGFWGAVRVVPTGTESTDVTLMGEIVKSTGMDLVIRIRAVDSTGRVWKDKKYKGDADPRAYADDAEATDRLDPYKGLFNRIANDLYGERMQLKDDEVLEIREMTRLRFATDLAPGVFEDYLRVTKKGKYSFERLPAADDPMMARVSRIRERDYMLVDTLDEYYADFYTRMTEPYHMWRSYSYEEQRNLQQIKREARKKQILGGLLILGGAMAGGSSTVASAAGDAAIIGGAIVLRDGISTAGEARIHREALRELAGSFDAEMAPLLVEVEGRTLNLQGSAEAQYTEWRRLLTEIFRTETGLPVDPDDGPGPSSAAAGER
jgi:hypothetical protein